MHSLGFGEKSKIKFRGRIWYKSWGRADHHDASALECHGLAWLCDLGGRRGCLCQAGEVTWTHVLWLSIFSMRPAQIISLKLAPWARRQPVFPGELPCAAASLPQMRETLLFSVPSPRRAPCPPQPGSYPRVRPSFRPAFLLWLIDWKSEEASEWSGKKTPYLIHRPLLPRIFVKSNWTTC